MCTTTWGVFSEQQTTKHITERLKRSKRNALTLKHISQCTETRADEEPKQALLSSKVWYTLAHMALHHCAACALGQINRAETTASQREVEVEGTSCMLSSGLKLPLTAVLGRCFLSHPSLCAYYTMTFRGVDCFNGISMGRFQYTVYLK